MQTTVATTGLSCIVIAVLAAAPATAVAEEAVVRMTLSDAIAHALQRNPTLVVAREEIRRAQALVEEARAQSLPTLYGTATYTRLDQNRVFLGTVTEPDSQINLSGLLTVPLVSPRTWAAWSHAKDNVGVSQSSALDVQRTFAAATAHAFLAVLAQKNLLAADVRARDTARAHFEYARSRFVGGVGTELDQTRAAQQVAVDEALVQAARAAVVRAEEALGVLAAVDVPVDTAEDPTLPAPPALARAVDEATRSRTDVVAQARKTEAAHHVSRDNWTEYSPFVSGTFEPFYQDPPTSLIPAKGWQAEVVLTVPFYDGGLRYGLGKERAALEREARVTLEGTVRQARSDVRAAFETLERAKDSLAQAQQSSRLASRALDLANMAYREGATTNLEVIDAEQAARDAQIQAEIAADSARQAQIDLLSAAGAFP